MEQNNNVLIDIRNERAKTHGNFNDGAEVFETLTAPITQSLMMARFQKRSITV